MTINKCISFCRRTEEGVSKVDEDLKMPSRNLVRKVPEKSKFGNPASVPEGEKNKENISHVLVEIKEQDSKPSEVDNSSDDIVLPHYDEVNAQEILYPKEKYKYYYPEYKNKESNTFKLDTESTDVFVYRAGKLVPLSSVAKNQQKNVEAEKENLELVYVYDDGKLLILGGSVVKVDPSKKATVRARVVVPTCSKSMQKFGVEKCPKNEIQAVYIDEKLANFALTALKKHSEELPQFRGIHRGKRGRPRFGGYRYNHSCHGEPQPGRGSSIVDVISAKLDLPSTSGAGKFGRFGGKQVAKSAKNTLFAERNSNLYKKNMDRFPSLFREMKRLNMNFVNFNDAQKVSLCNDIFHAYIFCIMRTEKLTVHFLGHGKGGHQ